MIDTRDLDEDDPEVAELFEELRGYAGDDPNDGVTLIPANDFKNYARDFAEEIGAISNEVAWPYTCIDWEHAADELAIDYTEVEFRNTTYLYR